MLRRYLQFGVSPNWGEHAVERRIFVVCAVLAALLLASFGWSQSAGASGSSLIQISSDPYVGAPGQHQTEAEPHALASGGVIVSAFETGIITTAGSTNIGWSTSLDGGNHWTRGVLPGTTIVAGGSYSAIANAVVARDVLHHEWLVVSLALTNPGPMPGGYAILVNRSIDGLHWDNALTVSTSAADGLYDKPWIVCDSGIFSLYLGNCYIAWTDVTFLSTGGFSINVDMATSTDGGHIWGSAGHPAGGFAGAAGVPQVQPTGTVIVPLVGLDPQTLASLNISSFVSTNGGASWSAPVTVTALQFHVPSAGIRADALPTSATDAFGKVYVVWSDCRFVSGCSANDLVIATTSDGVHWSSVQRIPIDPVGSVDHFLPGLGIDPSTAGGNAHLALVYSYFPAPDCTLATCRLDVGLVESGNGGSSWSSVTSLAGPMQLSWLAQDDHGGVGVGDYSALTFFGHCPVPTFVVAMPLQSGQYRQAIYTAQS